MSVYVYGKKSELTHLGCWAHARRELIQKLYTVERRAREQGLAPQQIKELRLKESLPIINELGKWMFLQIKLNLPKSQIGKALVYSQSRWDKLSAYLTDGNLQIDNNLARCCAKGSYGIYLFAN